MNKRLRLTCLAFLSTCTMSGHAALSPSVNNNQITQDQLTQFAQNTRKVYVDTSRNLAGSPDAVGKIQDIQIPALHPTRTISSRLYTPIGVNPALKLPIVLFIHGGGFVSGDLNTHDVLTRSIANRSKSLVLSIDYRLAPEYPYPAGLNDAYAALLWISGHASDIGADPTRIAVAGDSAGGNLATEVAMMARDKKGPAIVAQWLMYPTLSNKMDTASWQQYGNTNFPTRTVNTMVIAAYVPKKMSPYAAGIAPLWAKHNHLPATLLQVGTHDPLRDEVIDYDFALKKAGVSSEVKLYPEQLHGFIQFYKDKLHNAEGEKALDEGITFLNKQFKNSMN